MIKKIYKNEDLLVVPRNLNTEKYIKSNSINPENLSILWYHDKNRWVNIGDRSCIISQDHVPTSLDALPADIGLMSMDRNAVETDWQFQQIVVGLVIHSGPEMFLLKCKVGDMQDNLTLVQGHVNATRDMLDTISFGDILRENVIRETVEEVRFPCNPLAKKLIAWCVFDKNISPKLKFLTLDVLGDNKNISKYHIGYIFDINIPDRFKYLTYLLSSNEPNKNVSKVYDIRKGVPDIADSWVVEIIKYYRRYGGYEKFS